MEDKRIDDLEKRLKALEDKSNGETKEEKPKKEKKPRKPSAYNIFMSKKLKELKKQNPEMKTKDLMKKVAEEWNEQKEK